jgi:APA family basic amino acid/polyamine antiporter
MNSSGKLATTFKFIILISTLTALIAYLLSMAAYIIVAPRYVTEKKKLRIHLIVAFGGFLYALWAVAGAGEGSVYYGLLAVLAGIPIYAFQKIKIDKRGI